jgi:uncharacterized RDD family membrane protein YckC
MNSIPVYEGQEDLISEDVLLSPVVYAGFWLRFGAYIIDILIVYFAAILVAIPFSLDINAFEPGHSGAFEGIMLLLYLAVLSYFPLMESSRWQATLGKRAVGIVVTDMNGERISFGKALARLFSKIISGMILYIGFMMAGFTEKKQGLHDMIANTLVIKK